MAKKFDIAKLAKDMETTRKRHRWSVRRAEIRIGLSNADYSRIISGRYQSITIHKLAKILDFIGQTDVSKYIIEEEES